MKKLVCVWLLLSTGLLVAQTAQSNDKSMLIALENAWNQAQIHHDGKALNELVTDAFIYTDWDGTLYKKAKFIADAKDTSTQITSAANSDVEVYFYPGVAIVAGSYHTKGTSEGKSFDHRGRFTDTWILSKNEWKCVASHTNLIKK